MTVVVREGQSVFDIATQFFGTLENVFDVLAGNDILTLTDNIASGTEIEIDAEGKGEEGVKDFYVRTTAITNNGLEGLEIAIGGDFNNDFNNDFN